MLAAPSAAALASPAVVQQVLRPVAISLLSRLRRLAAAQQAGSGTRSVQTSATGPLGAGPTGTGRSSRRGRRMEDALSPKSPRARRAEEVMASAFNSPKRAGMSSLPPPPASILVPPLAGTDGSDAAGSPTHSASPPSATATARQPLSMESQLSMTDLVGQATNGSSEGTATASEPKPFKLDTNELMLDPNTPRSPKHQLAEQILTTGEPAKALVKHMDAVVKVFATHSKPNFNLPWQRMQQYTSKSTGFAVQTEDGQRWLLTNAHSVSYNTQVQLKKRGDDERYLAKVLSIGTECDVALLTVEDDEFWKDIVPLELSDLPALQESVAVLGYPIGGDSLAVSAGVVSRVQMTHYSHGCMSLLAVQTDAAINSGNSGGPVMDKQGKCVGVAFQSMTGDVQSVGYVIPTSVVRHFIEDYKRNGRYTGFPSLNVVWQEMDSKALKRAYRMEPHQKGVLVRSVAAASSEASVLQPDDIILSIDGVDVGNDGTVPFRHGERVDFKYVVTQKHIGDAMKLRILRGGEEQELEITLSAYQYLVPPHLRESKPSYFIVGGLVFTSCSDPYLVQRYGSLGASPVRLIGKTYFGTKSQRDEQVVLLSSVLASDATLGYEATLGIKDSPVTGFNGKPVFNLAQLARMVQQNEEPFLRIDLEAASKVVVVDAEQARKSTGTILEDHNISSAMSKDIQEQLEALAKEEAAASEAPAVPPPTPEKA
ncbi:Protease Do-like 9 [Chlorella sorokiniana]|uniref:Protease Do-like 9 n=1 Tax=Chlorella sorokiniana TaxID=3076 RepID=A0A2P6U1S7_CHLSO|nr:Protease Do-like 9 [Chlorella sorokiniana]|eukprot:PRW60277.1 Protease Do-like 9 [Chlorella sorokiniana]